MLVDNGPALEKYACRGVVGWCKLKRIDLRVDGVWFQRSKLNYD